MWFHGSFVFRQPKTSFYLDKRFQHDLVDLNKDMKLTLFNVSVTDNSYNKYNTTNDIFTIVNSNINVYIFCTVKVILQLTNKPKESGFPSMSYGSRRPDIFFLTCLR